MKQAWTREEIIDLVREAARTLIAAEVGRQLTSEFVKILDEAAKQNPVPVDVLTQIKAQSEEVVKLVGTLGAYERAQDRLSWRLFEAPDSLIARVVRLEVDRLAAQAADPDIKSNLPEEPFRILLLDDDQGMGEIIVEWSSSLDNVVVDVTYTEEEATRAYRENPPGLVIVDYRLRDQTGSQIIARMRGRGWNAPKIILTGYLNEAVHADCMDAGATEVIDKFTWHTHEHLAAVVNRYRSARRPDLPALAASRLGGMDTRMVQVFKRELLEQIRAELEFSPLTPNAGLLPAPGETRPATAVSGSWAQIPQGPLSSGPHTPPPSPVQVAKAEIETTSGLTPSATPRDEAAAPEEVKVEVIPKPEDKADVNRPLGFTVWILNRITLNPQTWLLIGLIAIIIILVVGMLLPEPVRMSIWESLGGGGPAGEVVP